MTKKRNRILNSILEIPAEVTGTDSKITMVGFNEILIENFKGILEYEEFYIKVNTELGIININGFNLDLKKITQEDILITGKIEGVDIERKLD